MNFKYLRRVWLVLGALFALAVVADAATTKWDLYNPNDGTTNWRDRAGTLVRVDRRVVSFYLADIGTAATGGLVTPQTGYVSAIYASTDIGVNADTILRCGVGSGASGPQLFTSGSITFTLAASAAGKVGSATITGNNAVTAGTSRIFCGSDGGATNTVPATVTVVIDGNF